MEKRNWKRQKLAVAVIVWRVMKRFGVGAQAVADHSQKLNCSIRAVVIFFHAPLNTTECSKCGNMLRILLVLVNNSDKRNLELHRADDSVVIAIFQVLQFQPLLFFGPSFSGPAFSATPINWVVTNLRGVLWGRIHGLPHTLSMPLTLLHNKFLKNFWLKLLS